MTWSLDGEPRAAHREFAYLSRLGGFVASPKGDAQTVPDSTVELTFGRYTHAGLHDQSTEVDIMPPIPIQSKRPDSEHQTLSATGTCGPGLTKAKRLTVLLTGSARPFPRTLSQGQKTRTNLDSKNRKPLKDSENAEVQGASESGKGEIRTLGWANPTPVFKTGAINRSATFPERAGGC